jgi:hypothetical protein
MAPVTRSGKSIDENEPGIRKKQRGENKERMKQWGPTHRHLTNYSIKLTQGDLEGFKTGDAHEYF